MYSILKDLRLHKKHLHSNSNFESSLYFPEMQAASSTPSGLLPPKTLWTKEEDQLLTTVVNQFGAKKWNQLAQFIPGRTGKQCRERWMAHISPNVRNDDFSVEEIKLLLELHQKYGNTWSQISQYFDRRPPNVIKNKFNCLLRKSNTLQKSKPTVKQIKPKTVRKCYMIPIQFERIPIETVPEYIIEEEPVFDYFEEFSSQAF